LLLLSVHGAIQKYSYQFLHMSADMAQLRKLFLQPVASCAMCYVPVDIYMSKI